MSAAVFSLLALLVAIVLSCTSRMNVGIVSIVFAWIIGTGVAGWRVEQVASGFPTALFLTLTGVSLLFAMAESNGTLERVARRAVHWARGDARTLPLLLFVSAGLLSSAGPGAISTVALLAPVGMAMGVAGGVAPVLGALMITNGANAGNLSPISAVGVIANTRMVEAGIGSHAFTVWFANFAAHTLAAAAAYAIFSSRRRANTPSVTPDDPASLVTSMSTVQRLTMAVLAVWSSWV